MAYYNDPYAQAYAPGEMNYNTAQQPAQPKPAANPYAQQLKDAYQKYLGRSASDVEINSRLVQPNFNIGDHLRAIASSSEAKAYNAKQLQQQTAAAAKPAQPAQPQRLDQQANRGFTGWGQYASQMGGFDLDRYQKDIIAAGPNHKEYGAKKITVAQVASTIDPRSPNAVQQLVSKLKAMGENVEFDGLDRIRFADAPQDGWIDVMENKQFLQTGKGPVRWQWLDNHGSGSGSQGGAIPGDVFYGSGESTTTKKPAGGGGGLIPPSPQSDIEKKLVAELLKRMGQEKVPDRTDAEIRTQADAYAAQVDRQRRQFMQEAAEEAGPYATGALNNERRFTAERAGQASGLFESQLIGREIEARRAEIVHALDSLRHVMTTQQENELKRELANLDAMVRREGFQTSLTEAKWSNETARRNAELQNKLGYAQLNQQGRQFNDSQALNWAQFNWGMNPNNPIFY